MFTTLWGKGRVTGTKTEPCSRKKVETMTMSIPALSRASMSRKMSLLDESPWTRNAWTS